MRSRCTLYCTAFPPLAPHSIPHVPPFALPGLSLLPPLPSHLSYRRSPVLPIALASRPDWTRTCVAIALFATQAFFVPSFGAALVCMPLRTPHPLDSTRLDSTRHNTVSSSHASHACPVPRRPFRHHPFVHALQLQSHPHLLRTLCRCIVLQSVLSTLSRPIPIFVSPLAPKVLVVLSSPSRAHQHSRPPRPFQADFRPHETTFEPFPPSPPPSVSRLLLKRTPHTQEKRGQANEGERKELERKGLMPATWANRKARTHLCMHPCKCFCYTKENKRGKTSKKPTHPSWVSAAPFANARAIATGDAAASRC